MSADFSNQPAGPIERVDGAPAVLDADSQTKRNGTDDNAHETDHPGGMDDAPSASSATAADRGGAYGRMTPGFLWHRTLAGRGALVIMCMLLAAAAVMMTLVYELQNSLFDDILLSGASTHSIGMAEEFEDRILREDIDDIVEEADEVIERWGIGVVGLSVFDAEANLLARRNASGFEDVFGEQADFEEVAFEAGSPISISKSGDLVFASFPVLSSDGTREGAIGRIQVVYDSSSMLAKGRELYVNSWIAVLTTIVVVCVAIGFTMQRTVSRPIGRTIAAMRAVADDRFDVSLPPAQVVELDRMTAALNVFQAKVGERLELAKRSAAAEAAAARAQSERLEEQARAEHLRQKEEAEKRSAEEAVRLREQALIDDLRKVVKGAAEGNFDLRMEDGAASSDMPSHVNGLLDTVSQSIEEVTRVFSRLAEGEVSVRMEGDYKGAFSRLQLEVNAAASQLDEALSEIFTRATDVLGDSSDLSEAATELSNRTERTAHTVAETTTALEMMVESIASTARLASEARESAVETEREAHDSDAVVKDAVAGMQAIEALSGKIGKTLDIIDDIAFQTNLLALNAGVEAARAGPAGRGFAIVASEVRALAGKVAEAAQQIGTLVGESSDRIKEGVNRVGRAGETLDALGRRIQRIGVQIDEIAEAAAAQSDGAAEMNEAMSRIDDATQQNAAMFEETTAANLSLNNAASRMLGLVSGFKTTDAASREDWSGPNGPVGKARRVAT